MFLLTFILDPETKKAIKDAIISTFDNRDTPKDSASHENTSSSSSDTASSSCSGDSQVDWNFQENHSLKSLPDKNLDFLLMSTCESTKCFTALWTNSVIEDADSATQKNIIRISNDIAVNVEEYHSLLLEKLDLITDIPFVERKRGKAIDRS